MDEVEVVKLRVDGVGLWRGWWLLCKQYEGGNLAGLRQAH